MANKMPFWLKQKLAKQAAALSKLYWREGGVIHIEWNDANKTRWKAALECVKRLEGAKFNPADKSWICADTEQNETILTANAFRKKSIQLPEKILPPPNWQTFPIEQEKILGCLRDYQVDFVRFMCWRRGKGALLADPPGCIFGGAEISYNRAGITRKTTLAELYKKLKQPNKHTKTDIKTYVRCLKDGIFGLNELLDILDKGIKKVLRVETESGKWIKLTPDHEMLTPNGWVQAGNLLVGDSVLTNGIEVCPICGSDENLAKVGAKYAGYCKKCIYTMLRNNHQNTEITSYIGTDGYRYLYHKDLCNFNGRSEKRGIAEHIVVMERHLGYRIPWGYHIHHKNGDKLDNRLENLEVLSVSEHFKEHERDRNFGESYIGKGGAEIVMKPRQDKILSITDAGQERVFDLVMADPYRNFIANKFVVHNCGKTLMSMAWMHYLSASPALIVTTATTKTQWGREISKWLPGHNYQILQGQQPMKLLHITTLINWDLLSYWVKELSAVKWQLIVADECQAIGNLDSKRTKAFMKIAKDVQVVGLSGTPMRTRPYQFFPILHIIAPTIFPNIVEFRERYCKPKHDGFGWTYNGAENMAELHSFASRCVLRREKSILNLPPMERIPVLLDISGMEEFLREEAEFFEKAAMLTKGKITERELDKRLAELSRTAFRLKEPAALSWLKEQLDDGEPMIVMCWHTAVLEKLMIDLEEFKPVLVNGSVTGKARDRAVADFKSGKSRLLLGNIQAAGVGLDGLQNVCTRGVVLEFPDSPNDLIQVEGRLWRSGQDEKVQWFYLLAAGSQIDEKRLKVLNSRAGIMDAILDGKTPECGNFALELSKFV